MKVNFFRKLAQWVVREGTQTGQRMFTGAQNSRLTSDWITSFTSADAENQYQAKTLRNRGRDLERNNEYAARYFKLLENNVLGACGIGLQMKIQDPNGDFDKGANDIIEENWEDQCKAKNFTVTGTMDKRMAERVALRSASRDGGALARVLRGFPNARKYAIQLLEIDQLDHEFNGVAANGNEVRSGTEYDQWRRPVAFHIFRNHPGDLFQMAAKQRERIPASDLFHIYMPTRIGQSGGVSWLAPSILPLKMLGGYEEAELIAAREAACKGYAIEKQTPTEGYSGDVDSQGRQLQDMEPGMGMDLNPGEKYVPIDPNHPNQAFGEFVKSKLRGTASGLGISYIDLANDLEGVNYSSIRAGLLETREEWKAVQEWFIGSFTGRIFEDWLETQLAFGLIKSRAGVPLPADKFDKFNKPEWKPRRWPWVDPLKDMQANVLAVEKGFNSRASVIAEAGGDVEDVFQELKEDKTLATKYGLEFPTDIPKAVISPVEGTPEPAPTKKKSPAEAMD